MVATDGDSQVPVSWNPSFGADEYLLYREDQGNNGGGGGGGDGEGFLDCPDGSATYGDCIGTCFNNEDCANATYDGCVDGNSTWLGDGYWDDGTL